jgi:hypothetical protein
VVHAEEHAMRVQVATVVALSAANNHTSRGVLFVHSGLEWTDHYSSVVTTWLVTRYRRQADR